MTKHRSSFLFAACFGVGVTLLCWLLVALPIPKVVQTVAADANVVPIFLGAESQRLYPYVPQAGWTMLALAIAQWFVVGFGLSILIRRWSPRGGL